MGNATVIESLGKSTAHLATSFFKSCEATRPTQLSVETRLQYSGIARLYQSYVHATESAEHVKRAKDLWKMQAMVQVLERASVYDRGVRDAGGRGTMSGV